MPLVARPFVTLVLTAESEKMMIQVERKLTTKALFQEILRLFDKLGPKAAGFIAKKQLSGQNLRRRTGELARAMFGKGEMIHGIPALRVGIFKGPALKYAGAHEEGKIIKPKGAKALAVPTVQAGSRVRGPIGSGRAVTAAGVTRFGPRQYPGDLVFIPIRRGKLVGLLVDPADLPDAGMNDIRRIQATYLLLRSIKIPARHPIRRGLRAFLPQIVKELGSLFREILRGRR